MTQVDVTVGMWHEKQVREIDHCPSYYAADFEVLQSIPGDYPLTVSFIGGYTVPMPNRASAPVATTRLRGALYSGMGGHNFASTALEVGEKKIYWEGMYVYNLARLVEAGLVTLKPEFQWLAHVNAWQHPDAFKTWAEVSAANERNKAEG